MPFARHDAWPYLLAGLAGLSAGTPTMPTKPPAPTPPPANLQIDGAHSEARFVVSLRIGMRTQGVIPKVSGEMTGNEKDGWQVLVLADGNSLVVKGPKWMERSTRSPEFLDVDAHPEIRFHSETFSDRLLHAGGRIRGKLTLRGLTRSVSFRLLPSACANPGRDCDMQVNGIINRKDFGMTAHPISVRDDVQLNMRVRLLQAAGGSP
jgi:polyisoprenoid-binding protein YceI